MPARKTPIFMKSMAGLLGAIILSIVFVRKGDKDRESFNRVDGRVLSVSSTFETYPARDSGKYRYLVIDNYGRPFELFIGNEAGDFKPAFENIDGLNPSDAVTIYFDETTKSQNERVNNLAYFIDRGNENVFTKGNSIKYMIYGLIAFCALFMVVLLVLKRSGKIT